MRLRHIEVFHAIYSCGSMTSAAALLNVSQPSISKVLAHAEQQLGFALFERAKGKLIPTPEAHQLFRHVTDVYQNIDRLRHVASNLRLANTGRIRVASTPAFGVELLPIAVSSFQKQNPDVVFEIETLHMQEISSALLESRIDIGLAFEPMAGPGIERQTLATSRFVVLAPEAADFDPDVPLSIADLAGERFIALNNKGPLGRLLSTKLASSSIELQVVAWTETYHVAKALVACGAGVSIADEVTARSKPRSGVKIIPFEPTLEFDIKAVHSGNAPLSLLANHFVEHLQQSLQRFLVACSALCILVGCATSPAYRAGEPCVTDNFTVSDTFQGARRGRCVVESGNKVRLSILREDTHVKNPSPWYSFRITPQQPGSATIAIDYDDWRHRYEPKISTDGLNWQVLDETQVHISEDEHIAEIHLQLDATAVWVSAQELITPPVYDVWTQKMLMREGIGGSSIGASRRGQAIVSLTSGLANDDVLLIVGRQHPPEVSGAFAFFSFAETLFSDSELAREFRAQFRIIAIPLLNPDGVSAGNWRHNLGEKDLNRDWGPFTQPETRAVFELLNALDDSGARVRVFADFHSTDRNLLYTQNSDFPTRPPDFTPIWLGNSLKRLRDYPFSNEAAAVSEQANSKNYMYKRYGIPAVTFEVGDETDRRVTRTAAVVFAEELMTLMLCAKQADDFDQCR